MMDYRPDFDSPWFLVLLAGLPIVWWASHRSLAGLGSFRKWTAIGLRTAVFVGFILAAAEVKLVRRSERLTTVFLLDLSRSIPAEQREAMIAYVNAAIREHRQGDDRAGVIVFGRDAGIEIPPFDDDIQLATRIESLIDRDYTNLSAAMRLAQAVFPEDTAKRIVIVSDGNENLGDALTQAHGLADAGIGIDVVPLSYAQRSEVAVDRLAIPSDVRQGQPFDMRIVVTNTNPDRAVSGRLILSQRAGDQSHTISEQPVTLEPGKRVFTLRQTIDEANFYTYEANFVPDDPTDDNMLQNNRAMAFAHVQGKGQVLLIEDPEGRGEHDFLVSRLRTQEIEVTVRPGDQAFASLAELQPFDAVILANVPRENFSDEQIQMLSHNTRHLGAGLIMLGGPNSFGAGGWTNTEVEKAMPLDFQIKSAKVVPKGALALVMHASEMAQGNYWQKKTAYEAIKALGYQDYCGLLHYAGPGTTWLWGDRTRNGMLPVGPSRAMMLRRLDGMMPGDMPDFDPALRMALAAFARLPDAAVKHMIIISDGDPSPPSNSVQQGLVNGGITVSTVAIGTHGPAGSAVLNRLATATGGKYWRVRQSQALPRIFQREARRVARPLIYERPEGFRPVVTSFAHEIVQGIDNELPPITGFVMTSRKPSALVEVPLASPRPAGQTDNNSILATWIFGAGRSVAFTTDVGARWSKTWPNWAQYDTLFTQIVRWAMRPGGDDGKFSVATEHRDGKVHVVVTAMDRDDDYLNFLEIGGAVIGPDMKPQAIELKQTHAGRYVATFDAEEAGPYFVMVQPGANYTAIRTGVNVPYSAEFRERSADRELLVTLARLDPDDGEPGVVIEQPAGGGGLDGLLTSDPFRHNLRQATSSQDAWHLALLAACCVFLVDVFVRRVHVSLAWVPPLVVRVRDRIAGRDLAPVHVEYMDRLRSRKAEVDEQLEQRRAAARFVPSGDSPVVVRPAEAGSGPSQSEAKSPPAGQGLSPGAADEEESYTDRLLKAKRKVWEDRRQDEGPSERT